MNNGTPAQSPAPQVPQAGSVPNSPSIASNMPLDGPAAYDPDAPKYFFQEKYAPLNVKGNFLTLCACPKNVELGEWLAHQSKRIFVTPLLKLYMLIAFHIQSLNSIACSMACSRSSRKSMELPASLSVMSPPVRLCLLAGKLGDGHLSRFNGFSPS
jgi:hypothetical protein